MAIRYLFGDFSLSVSRRLLVRAGHEVPLIPRYFDLLVLLIQRRDEAITRREILETTWADVVVSDGALSQAVRTLRRALGDDPRNPGYIRTVSRHGYQFVFPDLREQSDTESIEVRRSVPPAADADAEWSLLVDSAQPLDLRRGAAERLHELGTAAAVQRLGSSPGDARARALLRDTRWDVPDAGPVPILGQQGALRTLRILAALRIRRVLRVAGRRYTAAIVGATLAGLLAGLAGGLALYLGPGSRATGTVVALLPLVGAVIAALAAAGVAAGLCCAEVLVRSSRAMALTLFGAVGGAGVGFVAHGVAGLLLTGLFGQEISAVAGGLEGGVLGAATGIGYAVATPRSGGGMATPHGFARWIAALAAGVACAAAAALLTWSGSYLGAMSLDLLANRFPGSQVSLEPLARLLGESVPGLLTKIAIGSWEGFMFAAGTVIGLTHRPK